MKVSQPKTARIINTARVLCAVRKSSLLSKAQLARVLGLNKVSVGEIVDSLIDDGILSESGKLEVSNGRRPTTLELVGSSRFVLAVDIGKRNITTALCDINGQTVKLERIPLITDCTQEEFVVSIIKSIVRTVKLVDKEKLLGIGITVDGFVSPDGRVVISSEYLPWKNIELAGVLEKATGFNTTISDSVSSFVNAEKTANNRLAGIPRFLYVKWDSNIGLAIVSKGQIASYNPEFGNLIFKEALPDYKSVSKDSLRLLADALTTASEITGIRTVVVGGEGSDLADYSFDSLKSFCSKIDLEKSALGAGAEAKSAGETALDRFFYMSYVLDNMKEYL